VNGNTSVDTHSHDAEEEHEVEAQGVDIWVSSEYMIAQRYARSSLLMRLN